MKKKQPKIICITTSSSNLFGMSISIIIGLGDDGKIYELSGGKWIIQKPLAQVTNFLPPQK